jgi:hypothetical protein
MIMLDSPSNYSRRNNKTYFLKKTPGTFAWRRVGTSCRVLMVRMASTSIEILWISSGDPAVGWIVDGYTPVI